MGINCKLQWERDKEKKKIDDGQEKHIEYRRKLGLKERV